MDTNNQNNTIKAIAFLYKGNDDKNKCLLGEHSLHIIYKSKSQVYDLAQIQKITFERRKLMMPLIFGAVTAAFIIISMYDSYFNPWVNLSILMVSLAAVYIGWDGTNVLTIKEYNQENDFMLKHVSINMKAFINHVNKHIRFKKGELGIREMCIYHICQEKNWDEAIKTGIFHPKNLDSEGFIHAANFEHVMDVLHENFSGKEDLILLAIDAEKVTAPVRYVAATLGTTLFPQIYGSLNLDAVLDIAKIEKDKNGNFSFPQMYFEQND